MIQKILDIIKPLLPLAVTGGVILCCASAPALTDIPMRKSAPDDSELTALLQQIEAVEAEWTTAGDEETAAQPSEKAELTETQPESEPEAELLAAGVGDYEDGVYTGSGTGYGGSISVQVTVENAQITDITILSASGETESFFSRAKNVIPNVIRAQTWEVDTVSGATYSSRGILAAVKNALTGEVTVTSLGSSQNTGNTAALIQVDFEEPSAYRDGAYTGTAQGFGGMITVEVTIADGAITNLRIVSAPGETAAYLGQAESVLSSILLTQNPEVDTVSGATYSSSGIINAVKNALTEAAVEDADTEQEETEMEPGEAADPDITAVPENPGPTENPDTPDEAEQAMVTTETTTETYSGSSMVVPDEDEDFEAYSITVTVTVGVTVQTTITGTTKTIETTRRVTDVAVSGADGSNAVYTGRALSGMQGSLIASGVADTVSGATCSSAGIRTAYAAAMNGVSLGTETETVETEGTEEAAAQTEPAEKNEAAAQTEVPDRPEAARLMRRES